MILYLSFIIFSLIAAPLLLFLSPKWRRFLFLFAIFSMFALAAYNLSGVSLGSASILSLFKDIGLTPIELQDHPLSRIASFGFIFVGALSLLYGLDVAKPSEQATALVGIASAIGIVFSANFITLFLFWELLTLATSGLIILRNTPQSIVAGYKFLLFHIVGGLLMLLGIAEHYAATGSFALTIPEAGLTFFTLAVGFKAAFLPFHVWVAWGYPSASFPSSVVLAGLTTKIGIYALARLIPPNVLIMYIGASMAVFGFSCALLQKDLRKLLSYHIISQVGYMVAAVALGTYKAVDAGLLHLVNHMLYKALLFMSAGSLIYSTGTGNVHDLLHQEADGETRPPVWRALPIATIGAVVGALAIAGTPLFNGYVSKYLLKKAMHGAGAAETMLLVAGIGTSLSFCKFVYFGFIKPRVKILRPATKSMNTAILMVSAICILIGVFPSLVEPLLPNETHLHVYSVAGVTASLQFILAGVVIFVITAKILEKGIKVPPWVSIEYLLYLPLFFCSKKACEYVTTIDRQIDQAYTNGSKSMYKIAEKTAMFDGAIDDLYRRSADTARKLADSTKSFDENIDGMYERSGESLRRVAEGTRQFDEGLNDIYDSSGESLRRVAEGTRQFDASLNDVYEESGRVMRKMADGTKQFDESVNDLYESSGKVMRKMADSTVGEDDARRKKPIKLFGRFEFKPGEFNIKNLNFDTLLLAVMLAVFLIVLIYFSSFQ